MKVIAKLLAFFFKSQKDEDPDIARIRARIEVEEARAFRKGKLSPKYVFKYALIFLSVLFGTLFILGMFLPNDILDITQPLETLERLLNLLF